MGCYILDTRNTPLEDRAVPPKQGANQHLRICNFRPFEVENHIEVRTGFSLFVEYFMMRIQSEEPRLHIIVANLPNVKGRQKVTSRLKYVFSHESSSLENLTHMCSKTHSLLNIIVGCHPLEILRHVLEKEKIPDMGGPYNSGAILLAALARGPMATRLVLEYGASRFLKNNQRVSLQALIHYSCLGDPETNRTTQMLWQEGVLQSDDLPELENTLTLFRNLDCKSYKYDAQALERVYAMVEAGKTILCLQQLAKNVLCKALGPMPGRRQKVQDMNIEGYVKKQLLFADAIDTRMEHFSIVHNCAYLCENGCVDYDRYFDQTRQRTKINSL